MRLAHLIPLCLTAATLAGPLSPPGGPVVPTSKPLAEVEPRTAVSAANTPGNATNVFRITQPGSYYLTSNITVPSGANGISISASNVTLDLNGFTITGQAGSVNGITTDSTLTAYKHIRISNGAISGMGSHGVYIVSFTPGQAQQHALDRLAINASTSSGIYVNDARITDCQVQNCGAIGIYAFAPFDTTVDRCSASACGTNGIRVVQGAITNSTASANTGTGINLDTGSITACTARGNNTGLALGYGTISGCTSEGNTSIGIDLFGPCTATGNTVGAITGTPVLSVGFRVSIGNGARIQNNNISRVITGISTVTSNNLIINNTFRGCTNALSIAANNRVGPMVSATAQPAITGNSGGGLGATDPHANLIY